MFPALWCAVKSGKSNSRLRQRSDADPLEGRISRFGWCSPTVQRSPRAVKVALHYARSGSVVTSASGVVGVVGCPDVVSAIGGLVFVPGEAETRTGQDRAGGVGTDSEVHVGHQRHTLTMVAHGLPPQTGTIQCGAQLALGNRIRCPTGSDQNSDRSRIAGVIHLLSPLDTCVPSPRVVSPIRFSMVMAI